MVLYCNLMWNYQDYQFGITRVISMGLFDHDHGLFNILIDLEPYCTKGIPLKLFKTYLPERIQYTAINNEILESLNDSATMSKGGSENPGFRY